MSKVHPAQVLQVWLHRMCQSRQLHSLEVRIQLRWREWRDGHVGDQDQNDNFTRTDKQKDCFKSDCVGFKLVTCDNCAALSPAFQRGCESESDLTKP